MSHPSPRPLALTMGEPAGIGPDITIAAWSRRKTLDLPAFYLIADPQFIARRAREMGADIAIAEVTPQSATATFRQKLPIVPLGLSVSAKPAHPDASSAPAAIASIRRAVEDVVAGHASAVVTNPVAKAVLYRAGFPDPGHTEYLGRLSAELLNVHVKPVMMIWSAARPASANAFLR